MNLWRTRLSGGLVIAVVPLALTLSVTPAAAEKARPEAGFKPCHTVATSGSGDTLLRVCITKEGNVEILEGPAGSQHINLEGYVLLTGNAPSTPCPSTNRWDVAATQFGWGPATTTGGGSTLPLTVTRSTSDGKFKLVQKFTRNPKERELVIEMKLTNTSGTTQNSVRLARPADIDANGAFTNFWDKTAGTVTARLTNGVLLAAVLPPIAGSTAVISVGAYDAANCTQPTLAPPVTVDAIGVVQFNFGNMPNGTTNTGTLKYQLY